MRTLWMAVLLAALAGLGCRDELAGPKAKDNPSRRPQVTVPGDVRNAPALQGGAGRVLDNVPTDLTFQSGASWGGGGIIYLGAKVTPAHAKPGEQVSIANYFAAVRPPPQGFRFFMHIFDSANGQMLMNADHEIQNGALPLGNWPVGKVVEDVVNIPVPPSQGTPRVLLGFWNDQGRLQIDQPQARTPDGRMIGPPIEGEQPALPEYHVKRTPRPPSIDGSLSDEVWKSAEPVELHGSFNGGPVKHRTTARMLYDDKNVYIAFDCEDPDVWGNLLNRDDAIYTQEVVEAFFDANGDGKTYNELEVSPNNTIFDAYFVSRRSDLEAAKAWDSGMKTAVKVRGTINNSSDQDDGWSAEMQIPIDRLAEVPHVPPQKGDRWRFNLYRIDNHVEGQAFSPLFQNDFHNLPRFGWLVFE